MTMTPYTARSMSNTGPGYVPQNPAGNVGTAPGWVVYLTIAWPQRFLINYVKVLVQFLSSIETEYRSCCTHTNI